MDRPGFRSAALVLLAALALSAYALSLRARPARREIAGPGYLPAGAPLAAPRAPPPREGATAIDFATLSAFDYDPESDLIPDDVRALDGRRVELSGVMYYAVADPDRVTDFYLMPNHMICCFGTPRVNEAVEVKAREGFVTRYVLDYFLVRGILDVGAVRDEKGRVLYLYRIRDAVAEVLN